MTALYPHRFCFTASIFIYFTTCLDLLQEKTVVSKATQLSRKTLRRGLCPPDLIQIQLAANLFVVAQFIAKSTPNAPNVISVYT